MSRAALAIIFAASLFLAGCQSNSKPPKDASLYIRLGQDKQVRLIVDDLVHRAAVDKKVNFMRKGTPAEWSPTSENVAKLQTHLIEFIESVSGGPGQYHGRDMKAVHAAMHITTEEFDAFLWDVSDTMNHLGYTDPERTDLVLKFNATRKDIVTPED